MVYTDTHTHFYYETDEGKQAEMLQRCLDNNISRLFLPNVDVSSVGLMFDIVDRWPDNFFPMLGLHPCDVKANWQQEIEKIKQAGAGRKIYAIGEIGIDLYWDKTLLDEQLQAFEQQINWAKELDLPIVIHCRDAFDETYEVLQRLNDDKLRGIFHCFSGTVEQAQKVIDLGFYLGIGGVVTYKNAGLDKVVAQIDLKHLVLETDSPYLTPVPFRGKPNESSYLKYIAEKIADLHQVDVAEVARITTENSKTIFAI
ncbi:TatD family hydrolase [Mucilaginibacter jinjuensis]|uniref:TatD family hydrolase n=1 Tax=Mucilaginibacter jinjuensis TaxID=1176721 RepID=A0ABY7T697_9SPHI|nr:TatD family hydrolase [Mucilaginibacter jinjuensis]WCT11784.1 TatD family hydrolase [Mucilaginibacter jinjuensis]